MPRVVKPAHIRSAEILDAASRLIRLRSMDEVSIDDIVREAGIAKGTFYLYFRSKGDVLAALAERLVRQMVARVEEVTAARKAPLETFVAALAALKSMERDDQSLADALNRPENLELHERTNIAFVRQLGPVMAQVVERGCASGDFDVDDPLSTIDFILAGQAFLLGNQRFGWSDEEYRVRLMATLVVCERALGAQKGALVERCMTVFSLRPDR